MPEPLEPSTATRSPKNTSRSNGLHQPGQLQPDAGQRAHPGAPAAQPHRHLLVDRPLRRRPGRLELRQPGLHRAVLRGHRLADLRLLLQGADQLLEPGVLLLPAPVQLVQPVQPGLPGRRVRREAAAVHPGRVRLHGDHPVRRAGQQLAVVADEQHRLRGLPQPLLQPALARHVEVVVRLVQQQHLVRPAQQRLQREPLLLAAGQRAHHPVLGPLERDAERGDGDGVPADLGVVAAGVAPGRERGRVPQLGRLVLGLGQRPLGRLQLARRPPAAAAAPGRAGTRGPWWSPGPSR